MMSLAMMYAGAALAPKMLTSGITPMLLYANTRHTQKYFIAIMPKLRYDTNIKNVELPRLQGIIWAKYYRFPY